MKTRIILISLFAIIGMIVIAQRPTMELTFTADNNGTHVQLNSIKVINRTQGGDTVLYYPDTVLVIYNVGILEVAGKEDVFKVSQNYPNPVANQTTISLYVPEKDEVSIIVMDILGRSVLKMDRVLEKGIHSFWFTPGLATHYCFTAQWRGTSSSIKILRVPVSSYSTASLEYLGGESQMPQLKAIEKIQNFNYAPGDELLYIGYKTSIQQSGILDAPDESKTYTFQFATNIPCPGTPIVQYEGQVYNTIQIFSQCWLKENLNVGTMIQGSEEMTDNGILEKYCYNNEPDSCTKYGGLYQWNEMMQYITQQGTQGICPPGWHLPTDEEWKVLEGAADSQKRIGDPEWDALEYRGWDVGRNLKTNSGWAGNGNGIDKFGFSGQPGGERQNGSVFFGFVGVYGFWCTSTEYDNSLAWGRFLDFDYPQVNRHSFFDKLHGCSVRCVRDE